MIMDTHSINVCLLGVLHFLFYALFCIRPFTDAYNHSISAEEFSYGVYLITMAALAVLMIHGVKTKQLQYIGPFLIMITMNLVLELFTIFYQLPTKFELFSFLEKQYYKIGIMIISVYTIFTLYYKLRIQYLKEMLPNNFLEEEKKNTDTVETQVIV